MAETVSPIPLLPKSPSAPIIQQLYQFDGELIKALIRYLSQLARRANGSVPKDGSEGVLQSVWTPAYVPSTGAFGSVTYDGANTYGHFIRIGQLVQIWGRIRTTAITVGTAAGQVRIGGLPYTAGGPVHAAIAIPYTVGFTTAWAYGGLIPAGGASIALYSRASTVASSAALDVANLTTGAAGNDIIFTGAYIAATNL